MQVKFNNEYLAIETKHKKIWDTFLVQCILNTNNGVNIIQRTNCVREKEPLEESKDNKLCR